MVNIDGLLFSIYFARSLREWYHYVSVWCLCTVHVAHLVWEKNGQPTIGFSWNLPLRMAVRCWFGCGCYIADGIACKNWIVCSKNWIYKLLWRWVLNGSCAMCALFCFRWFIVVRKCIDMIAYYHGPRTIQWNGFIIILLFTLCVRVVELLCYHNTKSIFHKSLENNRIIESSELKI